MVLIYLERPNTPAALCIHIGALHAVIHNPARAPRVSGQSHIMHSSHVSGLSRCRRAHQSHFYRPLLTARSHQVYIDTARYECRNRLGTLTRCADSQFSIQNTRGMASRCPKLSKVPVLVGSVRYHHGEPFHSIFFSECRNAHLSESSVACCLDPCSWLQCPHVCASLDAIQPTKPVCRATYAGHEINPGRSFPAAED
jgi:hypothetical protein